MIDVLSLRRKLALEVEHKIQNNLIKEHPLRQIMWECTLRCNLYCRHCGSDCHTEASHPDMPLADFLRVLDSVKRSGADTHRVMITITGGEPLMRPDLEECGRAIYDREFPWGMVTNGLFLTPQRFSRLLAAGLHTMTVSLDGLVELHNWMRGNAKSFEQVDRALDLLVNEPSIRFDVVTCVNRRNYPTLPQIRDYLISKGVKEWRLFSIFPVGRAAQDPLMQLKPYEFRGMFDFIRQTRKEGIIKASYGCEGFLGNLEGEVRDHLFLCHAGITTGSVLADGSISACPSIRADYHQGNIYEDDFMEVWENRYQVYRNREWARRDECKDCKYFRYCRGNGMHLRDSNGKLLFCHLRRLKQAEGAII
ncbi:MAG: TIGR04133 family radical SAM/SPASM protein [Bacteroidaceae bacterium]|nr:TIGR04133 family radical SAM/SPASM protein [Bacteroidaceae bacterium]